jgi:hypothetical protein
MRWAELVDKVIREGGIKPNAMRPLQTYARQYAECFEVPADQCTELTYHLPPNERRRVILQRARHGLSPKSLRNLAQQVTTILTIGVKKGWIPRLEAPLKSWAETRGIVEKSIQKARKSTANYQPYQLGGQTRFSTLEVKHDPQTGEPVIDKRTGQPKSVKRFHFRVEAQDEIPAAFAAELEAYRQWSTNDFQPGRGKRLKKNVRSWKTHERVMKMVAGFAVNVERSIPRDMLALKHLTDPALLARYVSWLQERRGRLTQTPARYLDVMRTVATYWVKDEAHVQGIIRMEKEMPEVEPVIDKASRMHSLKELETIAENIYPLNARRLIEPAAQGSRMRRIARHLPGSSFDINPDKRSKPGGSTNLRRIAYWAQVSLMIRLWIRCPLRSRNYREARLGVNTEHLPDGTYVLKWQGPELKVPRRDGKVNQYRYVIDQDLMERWNEFLSYWRPLLAQPGETHLFLNSAGKPFNEATINWAIRSATWRFTGKIMHPHLIRDCYASDMLAHGASIHDVARALNDTMQTVYHRYAHIIDTGADQRRANMFNACLT